MSNSGGIEIACRAQLLGLVGCKAIGWFAQIVALSFLYALLASGGSAIAHGPAKKSDIAFAKEERGANTHRLLKADSIIGIVTASIEKEKIMMKKS